MKLGARPNNNILICGAGIAGLTLAFWLKKYGFTPTLIERAPSFRNSGYMIDIWGTGYDVLEQSGFLAEARSRGYPIDRLVFVDDQGRKLSGYGGDVIQGALHDRFFSIPRGDLASVLHDALDDQVVTIYDTSIKALNDNGDAVDIVAPDNQTQRFDIVIGADGSHSRVRALIFGAEEQFRSYLGYYAASFIATGYQYRNPASYICHARPGRQIGRYTMRNDRSGFLFVFAERELLGIERHSIGAQKDAIRSRFAGDGWETAEILANLDIADELYFDTVSQIRMPKWSCGRTALVGDAAYCLSLLSGEGAAFAMLGAYILAGELHRADGDYVRAFSIYETRLRDFLRRKQNAAARFSRYFSPRTEMGLATRNIVLNLMAVPAIGKRLTRIMFADAFELPEYE